MSIALWHHAWMLIFWLGVVPAAGVVGWRHHRRVTRPACSDHLERLRRIGGQR